MESVMFSGHLTAGKLAVRGWAPIPLPDGEVLITVEPARAIRSKEANALYWAGYVRPLADYTGYTPAQMHAYLKRRFLPKQKIVIVGRDDVPVDYQELDALTTTTLTTAAFSIFLEEIEVFAESLRVPVGPPGVLPAWMRDPEAA